MSTNLSPGQAVKSDVLNKQSLRSLKVAFTIFFSLIVSFLACYGTASADLGQLVDDGYGSQNINATGGASIRQTLGTGLSGTVTSVVYRTNRISGSTSAFGPQICIVGYASEAAFYANAGSLSSNCGGSVTGSPPTETVTMSLSLTLDPTRFYVLWNGNFNMGSGRDIRARGSVADTAPGVCLYGNTVSTAVPCTGITDIYYLVLGADGPLLATQVLSIYPTGQSFSTTTASTTVTVGGRIYVLPEDYEDGMVFEFSARNDGMCGTLVGPIFALDGNGCGYSVSWDIATSGYSTFSTTTTGLFTHGVWNVQGTILAPPGFWSQFYEFLGFGWGADGMIHQLTGVFINGALNAGDHLLLEIQEAGDNLISTSTIADFKAACSWDWTTSFSLWDCLSGFVQFLFVPSSGQLATWFEDLREGFLTRVPFGYVTRFVAIVTSLDSVQPPPLQYSFGTASPDVLQGLTDGDPVAFQVFDHFGELESAEADDGSGKNIWDIVMPYFETVVTLAVLAVILEDLLGFRFVKDNSDEDDDQTTPKRYVLSERQREHLDAGRYNKV